MNKEAALQVKQMMVNTTEEISDIHYIVMDRSDIRDTSKMALLSGEKFILDMTRHLQSILKDIPDESVLDNNISFLVLQCQMLNTIAKSLIEMATQELNECKEREYK